MLSIAEYIYNVKRQFSILHYEFSMTAGNKKPAWGSRAGAYADNRITMLFSGYAGARS